MQRKFSKWTETGLMSQQVRTARWADFDRLMDLYSQLHPDESDLDMQQPYASFKLILSEPWLHLIVLEDAETVRSTCYLNVIPNLTRSARPYGLVENVVTDQAFRRKGFGRKVIAQALELAWQANCYKVMLLTGSKRASTHAFYAACGFSGNAKQGYIARNPA